MQIERLKPFEHAYKHSLFGLLRPLLKRGDGSEGSIPTQHLRRVLFLRPERLGDLVISLPVFDGLRQAFPQVEIGLVASTRNVSLVQHDPRFFRLYIYQKQLFSNLSLIRTIQRDQYDAVIDMICDDSVTALLMAQLCAPGKPRIGVGKTKHRPYYDRSFDYRLNNTGHVVPNTLQLLRAFGIDDRTVSGYAAPFVDEASEIECEKFWTASYGSAPFSDQKVIGLNLSAGAPNRVWPLVAYAAVIRELSIQNYRRFLIFAIGDDLERAEQLRTEFPEEVRIIPRKGSIVLASALVRRLHALISPDTSLIHIARSFRIPVVGLYNQAQRNFTLWRPYDQEAGALVSDSAASIISIRAESVVAELLKVLARTTATPV